MMCSFFLTLTAITSGPSPNAAAARKDGSSQAAVMHTTRTLHSVGVGLLRVSDRGRDGWMRLAPKAAVVKDEGGTD
jgi:hypothetical protein